MGAEPFSAKIRYTGPDDPDFPNLIKLTINMPHMDGELTHAVPKIDILIFPNRNDNNNQRICENIFGGRLKITSF